MTEAYIIGEIGQNHNGSMDIAKLIIDVAAREVSEDLFHLSLRPMDAVKLTKRDLSQEMSASMMHREYRSVHAFGKTYGEHRRNLELNDEQHRELYEHAKSRGLDFVETLCSPGCLTLLRQFKPDHLKVASRDLTNPPLLEALAETRIPMIMSTGMSGKQDLDRALDIVTKHHTAITILHCVSEYPTHPGHVNLLTIPYLKEHYPEYRIGYSDHSIGIMAPVAAVALGAEVIEKHITIDRQMKGTDQAGSLQIDGIRRMVRDIRLLEMMLGEAELYADPATEETRIKLERSVAVRRFIKKGEVISESDLILLSPGDGFRWKDRANVIGAVARNDIHAMEIVYERDIAFPGTSTEQR
jgi:sialic acid synthase